jgi:tetratricopeptide (TPR) repeat protein
VWAVMRLFAGLPPLAEFPPSVAPNEARRRTLIARACLRAAEVWYFADFSRGLFYAVSAFLAARSLGSSSELTVVSAYLGLGASFFGLRPVAEVFYRRARVYMEGRSPVDRSWVHTMQAMSLSCYGDAEGALLEFRRAEEVLAGTHEPMKLRQVFGLCAELLCSMGDLEAADERALRVLRLAEELRDERGRGWGLSERGQVASRRGKHVEAQAWLQAAARHSEHSGDINWKLQSDALRAFDLLLEGHLDEALALSDVAAREWARRRLRTPNSAADGVFLAAAALVLKRDGRIAPSTRRQVHRVRLLRWYQAQSARLTRPMFRAGCGAIDVASGKVGRGMRLLEKAGLEAEAAGLFGTALDVFALASRVLPEPHRTAYAEREAELRQRLGRGAR